MVITTEYVDIPAGGSPMRMFVAAPKAPGKYPGIVCYSDIFQLTGTMLRSVSRLAGYGFVAAAPEFGTRDDAVDWMERERLNLDAMVMDAVVRDRVAFATALPAELTS